MSQDILKAIIPAELFKSEDGEWKIRGLASTNELDQQGEIVLQSGIDLTPIDQKKGVINYDHRPGPENIIGLLDGYVKNEKGLYIEGRLLKNHSKAKAVYEIMSSLSEKDRGRVGLSVEGKILKRNALNPKIIEKCEINAVAITLNPVNRATYADLAKSMQVDFNSESLDTEKDYSGPVSFTAEQVLEMIQKALSAGAPATQAPADRSGGAALGKEDLDKNCWTGYKRVPGTKEFSDNSCVKKNVDMDKGGPGSGPQGSYNAKYSALMSKFRELSQVPQSKEEFEQNSKIVAQKVEALNVEYGKPTGYAPTYKMVVKSDLIKSNILEVLERLQTLHPETKKAELWESLKDRLLTKFPDINEEF